MEIQQKTPTYNNNYQTHISNHTTIGKTGIQNQGYINNNNLSKIKNIKTHYTSLNMNNANINSNLVNCKKTPGINQNPISTGIGFLGASNNNQQNTNILKNSYSQNKFIFNK